MGFQADVHLSDGSWYRAAVPSGASTGESLLFRFVSYAHLLGVSGVFGFLKVGFLGS